MNQLMMIRVLEIYLVVKAMRLESYDAFEPHPTHRHLNAYKIIRFTVYDRPHSEGQLHFYGFITRNSRNFPYFSFITFLESLQAPTRPSEEPQNLNGPASPQSPTHDQRRTSWRHTRQLPAEPPRRSAHQSRECGEYEQSTAGSAPQSSPRPQSPEP
mgnify:CR=1 FL=1